MPDSENKLPLPPPGTPPAESPRQQERSLQTRQDLLEAARIVFARDGFDRARLQDISALAGKTRGAFYAHFQDKEDVFFAIFEQDIQRDSERFADRLRGAGSQGERIHALANHLAQILQNRSRVLLSLEFKLYALRHAPEQQRLVNLHAAMCLNSKPQAVRDLLPEFALAPQEVQRRRTAQFGALMDGLGLSLHFDPDGMDQHTLLRQMEAGVRNILLEA